MGLVVVGKGAGEGEERRDGEQRREGEGGTDSLIWKVSVSPSKTRPVRHLGL